jgi:acetolactate synthase I/II/III large subunit
MPKIKGAELITEYLIASDIPYVFGICGHGNVGMLDPLYEARDRIQLVSPRHEQVAVHMADAYFRVKHKPVATLTSCGPGSCNIIMCSTCTSMPKCGRRRPVPGNCRRRLTTSRRSASASSPT